MRHLILISRVTETGFLVQHGPCECICTLNESVCNSKQKWNHDECCCKSRELYDWSSCEDDCMWDFGTCDC